MSEEKKDTQSRKWMVTINNPEKWGYTHQRIKQILENIKSIEYWCMCDEIGNKAHTPHTHLVIFRRGAIRFSTLKKHFPEPDLTMLRGTVQQARDYVRKEGKHKDTDKQDTNLPDTFEESGIVPVESQGQRNDLVALYDQIRDGKTNFQILEENPNYMLQLDKIDRCREIMRYEEFKSKRRELYVEYLYGPPRTGKTSSVLDTYGDANVYRVTNSRNPWDDYVGQDIVLFDDFRADMFPLDDLLRWLDIYPLRLPCRYNNKMACYTKVYFTSNVPLKSTYLWIQEHEPYTWQAFLKRIHKVIEFTTGGMKSSTTEDYISDFRYLGDLGPFSSGQLGR